MPPRLPILLEAFAKSSGSSGRCSYWLTLTNGERMELKRRANVLNQMYLTAAPVPRGLRMARFAQIVGAVYERQMRERLREIPEHSAFLRVVLLRE